MNRNTFLPIGLVLAAFLVVGAFIVFKNYTVRKSPVPVVVPAEKAPEKEIVEEPVPEEPQEPPKSKRPKRSVKEVNDDLNRSMAPMTGNGGDLPTEEEAINMAWDALNTYRDASPEEKQQMVMGIMVVQGVINGFSQNAGMFLQQMTPEAREQIVNSAMASQGLLDAVQNEMAGNMTDEEIQVFGGLFQSFRNASQAFSNVPMYYPQQQF